MKRMVFLSSGGGGNLKFISQCIANDIIRDYVVVGVIADRDCGALQFAAKVGLPYFRITYSRQNNAELKKLLEDLEPDVIITNIHKILDADIVGSYRNKLLNLHYSLLPAFAGMIGAEAVLGALKKGCKFIGTTVHFVEDEVDAGAIISQSAMAVPRDAPFEELMDCVFRSGCLNLKNALQVIGNEAPASACASDSLPTTLGHVSFSPPLLFDPAVFTEEFWQRLK